MDCPQTINCFTIEIYGLQKLAARTEFVKDGEYIALAGVNKPAVKLSMPLSFREFLVNLRALRYKAEVPQERVDKALRTLATHAADFLPDLPDDGVQSAMQIDLVLGATELWAFPFEACQKDGRRLFADSDKNFVITRRIRQEFVDHRNEWPVRPRVLFAHAPDTMDLPAALIDKHFQVLKDSLAAWSSSGDVIEDDLLNTVKLFGVRDLRKAIEKARDESKPYTHVHLLAHGKAIIEDPLMPDVKIWGLRLGVESHDGTNPSLIAEVLTPKDSLPAVVTAAVCDSGNQDQTVAPERSFAQELHTSGVSCVLASQLPLTQSGSVTLTRVFYEQLLLGSDVRWALHVARLALGDDPEAGHDWLSLVGYIQLPEGYSDHLLKLGIKREMELLKSQRKRLDQCLKRRDFSKLDDIADELSKRIASLEKKLVKVPSDRQGLCDECRGIYASAHKRLAEVLFARAEDNTSDDDRQTSRESLLEALKHYSETFRANIHNHWHGVQNVALDAVLHGKIDDKVWDTTRLGAELDVANSEAEFWGLGTLAELSMLAPLRGAESNIMSATEYLAQMHARIVRLKVKNKLEYARGDAAYGISSTRAQFQRYLSWWTKENGFFGDRAQDFKPDAQKLVNYLDKLSKEG